MISAGFRSNWAELHFAHANPGARKWVVRDVAETTGIAQATIARYLAAGHFARPAAPGEAPGRKSQGGRDTRAPGRPGEAPLPAAHPPLPAGRVAPLVRPYFLAPAPARHGPRPAGGAAAVPPLELDALVREAGGDPALWRARVEAALERNWGGRVADMVIAAVARYEESPPADHPGVVSVAAGIPAATPQELAAYLAELAGNVADVIYAAAAAAEDGREGPLAWLGDGATREPSGAVLAALRKKWRLPLFMAKGLYQYLLRGGKGGMGGAG